MSTSDPQLGCVPLYVVDISQAFIASERYIRKLLSQRDRYEQGFNSKVKYLIAPQWGLGNLKFELFQ